MRYFLLILAMSMATMLQAQQITRMEYFLDTDPGFGQATPLAFTASGDEVVVNAILPLNDVATGFHTLYVRAKNDAGVWSITSQRVFYNQKFRDERQAITAVEYFIDTDPGFGNGTAVPFTADTTDLALNISLEGLDTLGLGFHILYVRAKDNKDDWSITAQRVFYLEEGNGMVANIARLEYYYVHESSVVGQGTYTYNFPNPATTIDTVFSATVEPLVNGQSYVLYVWAFDENDVRSLIRTWAFTYNEAVPIVVTTEVQSVGCSDTETGSITVNATGGEGALVYSISTDSASYTADNVFENLAPGTYTVFVHGSNEGYVASKEVEITSTANALQLTQVGETSQPTCENPQGGGFEVAASGGAGSGFAFSLDDGSTYQPGGTFSNLSAGDYTVMARDANGCTTTLEVAVTSSGNVPPTPTIRRSDESDFADAMSLIAENVAAGSTIQWYKDGEAISGATDPVLPITEGGRYQVEITVDGCTVRSEVFADDGIITGVDEEINQAVRIYPNPMQEMLVMEVPSRLVTGEVRVQLINSQGKLLQEQQLVPQGAASNSTFEVSSLPTGLYIVTLRGADFYVRRKVTKE